MSLLLNGERIAPARPGKDAVRGQIRKLTNEGQAGGFKRGIGAKKSSSLSALDGVGANLITKKRHLRILIRLGEHRAPNAAFCFCHQSSESKNACVWLESLRHQKRWRFHY